MIGAFSYDSACAVIRVRLVFLILISIAHAGRNSPLTHLVYLTNLHYGNFLLL